MSSINYNERSWAIDVISYINVYLSNRSKTIKSAGGENTIKNNRTSLFPDILLYGDSSKGVVLQGWELKMPDTPVNDSDLLTNAIKKANILHLNSFILWNVQTAVIYTRNEDNEFSIFYTWDSITINKRAEVQEKQTLWENLLVTILEDLNFFFENGEITQLALLDSLSFNSIIDVVLQNTKNTSFELRSGAKKFIKLDAEINLWWRAAEKEYVENKFDVLSKIILTDWVIKIVFANILKRFFNEAKEIEKLDFDTSVSGGLNIVSQISESCNFWNIFNSNLGQEFVSNTAWNQIIQLNFFLKDLNFKNIDINVIHELLQSSISISKRRVAGQYSTPQKLAELLARLTIENKNSKVLDPCCGTGTIINEAYKLMMEYEVDKDSIEDNIWASDKHAFPVQLSTLTLTKPENIGRVIRIFKSDVIDLAPGEVLQFKNPHDGSLISHSIPKFNYIISNLPFIQSSDIAVLNPDISSINQWISENSESSTLLDGRSDIYAYIPFYLWDLVEPLGKIGLILSNAFLGTKYGKEFLEIFQWFYEIEEIIISGKGRWFGNADVVTAILTGRRKKLPNKPDGNRNIKFVVLKEHIDQIENIDDTVYNIVLGISNKRLQVHNYSVSEISDIFKWGFNWSALFGGFEWFEKINDKITYANRIFKFIRGERRGWNHLFYPADGHGIEDEFLRPVLKNLRNSPGLISGPNKNAFCCSKSKEQLQEDNNIGALNWIRSFENSNNNTGVPLTESLKRKGLYWYEMKDTSLADFVANLNYDKSLFISRLNVRSFVDQRVIGFSLKPTSLDFNRKLLHALMNTTLSMFFIESIGFGRGLGALDLSKTRFENSFLMLDPNLLTENQKLQIVNSFEPLLKRDRMTLLDEINANDRCIFEKVVMQAYGIFEYYEAIKKSLLELYKIRHAAIN